MIVAGLIFAAVAALIHIYIFYLESIAWESERARAAFGTGSVEEARTTKFMAFNQGFYNLFLALLAIVGIAAQGRRRQAWRVPSAGNGVSYHTSDDLELNRQLTSNLVA
jgi:putative membrane protein